MSNIGREIWKISIIPSVLLLIIVIFSVAAYSTRFDLSDYTTPKWTQDELKKVLNIVKDGYANSYNNIPDVDRKELREEKKLSIEDIISDSKRLTDASKESNRNKAKDILNSVLTKIKSYDKSVGKVFQVTVTRLEIVRKRL